MDAFQNFEERVWRVSRAYRRALQRDLNDAIEKQNWDEHVNVSGLKHSRYDDRLANQFFRLQSAATMDFVGYIFPFRRLAVADRIPFTIALADVLRPQGYEVSKYSSHRGIGHIDSLLYFLENSRESHFLPIEKLQ